MTRNQFNTLSTTTIPSKVHINTQTILIARHYLLAVPQEVDPEEKVRTAYLNAYLFSNFGIVVDRPELLTETHVEEISDLFKLNVPASFYKNPQDTKYYTSDELFVNQVLAYFLAYGEEDSSVDVFDKELPEYPEGKEIKLREFKILFSDEANKVLTNIAKSYADYKRPWSLDEENEFVYLYEQGYYKDFDILCADNAITMIKKDANFARFLYKKDLVKISVAACGEKSKLVLDKETANLIRKAIPLVKDCPMSKKQAKYSNQ